MLVCEKSFDTPDWSDNTFSLSEFDFYLYIPKQKLSENHRLSMHKNLTTGQFEVYKYHHTEWPVKPDPSPFTDCRRCRYGEVVFAGTFDEALAFGNKAAVDIGWPEKSHNVACPHTKEHHSYDCPDFKEWETLWG